MQKDMIAVMIMFGVELLTILFLGLTSPTAAQDLWVFVIGIAAVIGGYWQLKMESQKIKIQQEQLKIESIETVGELSKQNIELRNKVESSQCNIIEREHKKEIVGLTVLLADLSKDLVNDMKKMNQKIDDNHNDLLNTILSIVTNHVVK